MCKGDISEVWWENCGIILNKPSIVREYPRTTVSLHHWDYLMHSLLSLYTVSAFIAALFDALDCFLHMFWWSCHMPFNHIWYNWMGWRFLTAFHFGRPFYCVSMYSIRKDCIFLNQDSYPPPRFCCNHIRKMLKFIQVLLWRFKSQVRTTSSCLLHSGSIILRQELPQENFLTHLVRIIWWSWPVNNPRGPIKCATYDGWYHCWMGIMWGDHQYNSYVNLIILTKQ